MNADSLGCLILDLLNYTEFLGNKATMIKWQKLKLFVSCLIFLILLPISYATRYNKSMLMSFYTIDIFH